MNAILGTGIDIVEVERIEQAIDHWGEHFLNHVFCAEEIAYAQRQKRPGQHFAGRFAAKEAVIKALGDHRPANWKDLKIINDTDGKPHCVLPDPPFPNNIHISISHSDHYAVASAIITP